MSQAPLCKHGRREHRGSAIAHIDRIEGAVDGKRFVALHVPGHGCCEVSLSGECASLRRMFVMPAKRLRGVGTALFAAAINAAAEAGKLSLAWTVRKDNAAAFLFYTKLGGVIFHDDADDYWFAFPIVRKERS